VLELAGDHLRIAARAPGHDRQDQRYEQRVEDDFVLMEEVRPRLVVEGLRDDPDRVRELLRSALLGFFGRAREERTHGPERGEEERQEAARAAWIARESLPPGRAQQQQRRRLEQQHRERNEETPEQALRRQLG